MVPIFFMLSSHGLSYCEIYFIAFIVLALKANMKKKIAIYIFVFNLICFLFYFFTATYRIDRLLSFLHPFSDPEGSGYLGVKMYKIIHTSGILGNGFSENEKLLQVLSVGIIMSAYRRRSLSN